MKNRAVKVALSLTVSALFLFLTFRHVDLRAAWKQTAQVTSSYLLLFVLGTAVIHICRILRWDALIRHFARIPLSSLFRISCLGLMLILVLPLRLGEFARPYLLKRESGAPLSSGLGSVAVERSTDGLLVTLLFFAGIFALPDHYAVPSELRLAGYGALALFSASTAVVVLALTAHATVNRLLRSLLSPLAPRLADRVVALLEAFVQGLRSLPDVKAVAVFLLGTLGSWGINGLIYYALMRAFGWDVPVSAGFVTVAVIAIVIMIPAGPGFLGTFQGGILAGLAIFGVGATEAAAFGLVAYPLSLIVPLAFGLPYLFAGRGQVGEIVRASTQAGH